MIVEGVLQLFKDVVKFDRIGSRNRLKAEIFDPILQSPGHGATLQESVIVSVRRSIRYIL